MANKAPILYSFRRCPFAMRARMALIISKIDYEHREILLRDKPGSMLAFSPKGTVPVLALPSGKIIDESLDIMLWALKQHDPENWLTGKIEQMKDLIQLCQNDFKPHLDRYKYASRYKDNAKRGDTDLSERAKAELYIKVLEARLTKNDFLFGITPRLADYAIFPFIRQFANTDINWWNGPESPPFPKTHNWLSHLVSGEIFIRCMQKYTLWSDELMKNN